MTARIANFGLRSFRTPPNKWQPRWYQTTPEKHLGSFSHTSINVFSFGMILYELFEPEEAKTFWKKKTSNTILKGGRPKLALASSYPKGLRELIERCWTQIPQEQPSIGSIISELEEMADHLSRSKFFKSEFRDKGNGDLRALHANSDKTLKHPYTVSSFRLSPL